MNAAPAFQFYADDFLAGTLEMTPAEVGTYIRLLCYQWSNGSIPNDLRKLKLIAGGTVSQSVLAKFRAAGEGRLANDKMERVRAAQQSFSQAKSSAGRKGADKRWHSHSTAIAVPLANGMAKDNSPVSILHTPVSSSLPPCQTPRSGGGSEDEEKASASDARDSDSELLRQVEEVWVVYPKKVATIPGKLAIRDAIRIHGFEVVLRGTRAIAEADGKRNGHASTGRFLPRPDEFFGQARFLDDPAQYGPRVGSQDPVALRKQIEDLSKRLAEHPGNPENSVGSLERKKVAEPEYRTLLESLRKLRADLGDVTKEVEP